MPIPNNKPAAVPVGATVRVDKLAHGLAEVAFRRGLEPVFNNAPLWDYGLGDVVRTAIDESGLPVGEISMVDLARKLGILGPAPRGRR